MAISKRRDRLAKELSQPWDIGPQGAWVLSALIYSRTEEQILTLNSMLRLLRMAKLEKELGLMINLILESDFLIFHTLSMVTSRLLRQCH